MRTVNSDDVPAIEARTKTIQGLNQALTDPLGRPLKEASGEVLTLRLALLLAINYHKAPQTEAIYLYTLACKIRDAGGDSLPLAMADYSALQGVIDKNPAGWGVNAYAQVCLCFA